MHRTTLAIYIDAKKSFFSWQHSYTYTHVHTHTYLRHTYTHTHSFSYKHAHKYTHNISLSLTHTHEVDSDQLCDVWAWLQYVHFPHLSRDLCSLHLSLQICFATPEDLKRKTKKWFKFWVFISILDFFQFKNVWLSLKFYTNFCFHILSPWPSLAKKIPHLECTVHNLLKQDLKC